MGLIASVFVKRRWHNEGIDCTINGWSARFDEVCVVNVEGPFEPDDKYPAVMLVPHRTLKHAIHVVLVEHHEKGLWTMAGGNYLSTTDSRFWEGVAEIIGPEHRFHGAVAIHDRIER